MRSIDADQLVKSLSEQAKIEWNQNTGPYSWAQACEEFIEEIDSMETLHPFDALGRGCYCWECEHSYTDAIGIRCKAITIFNHGIRMSTNVSNNHFCSYGIRRKDNDL